METKEEDESKKGLVRMWLVISGVVIAGALVACNELRIWKKTDRNREALVMATSLATAIENFYGEYDRVIDLGGSWVQTEGPEGRALLAILLGLEKEGPQMQNPRQIIFLQGKEAKGRKGGLVYEADGSVSAIYDPHGRPYTVILNGDESDALEFKWGDEDVRLRGERDRRKTPAEP